MRKIYTVAVPTLLLATAALASPSPVQLNPSRTTALADVSSFDQKLDSLRSALVTDKLWNSSMRTDFYQLRRSNINLMDKIDHEHTLIRTIENRLATVSDDLKQLEADVDANGALGATEQSAVSAIKADFATVQSDVAAIQE